MTKGTLTGMLAGLLALLAAALPLRAAEEAKAPRTYAVLVGIGKYSDAAIKGRPHAEDDARALYDLFTDKDHLGVDKDHVKLLLGGAADAKRNSQEATQENVLKAAKWVVGEAGRDDLVIFAFIGQGAAVGDRADRIAYFATDSGVKDPVKTGVLAGALADEFDKLKSRRACFFVDVYFKGYAPAKGGAPADPNVGNAFFKEFLGKDNEETDAPAPGRALFLATAGVRPSPDADKHGAFTQVVLDGLRGKADTEGYEPDGVVTVDELSKYLDKELPPLVKKLVPAAKDRPRHITLQADDAHYVLTYNPAAEAKVKERLDKLAALAKGDNKLTAEVVQEGKLLLNRMPTTESRRDLRKEYEALTEGKEGVAKFLENRARIVEGTKLSRADARDFADKVLTGIALVRKHYVKELGTPQLVDWAVRGLYRKLDEPVPDEVAKKLAGIKDMKESELQKLLTEVRQRLGKREDLDKHKDVDTALLRMLSHLDPYTTFYTPDELERDKTQITGQFIGVGIQIRKDPVSDQLQVISPIFGSPAFKAGVQAGDLITTITREVDAAGKPLDKPDVIETKGLDTNDAVKKILGAPGTKVKLTVTRAGVDKPLEFELARQKVMTESVLARRKDDATWDYVIDPDSKIGYVRLTQFIRNSTYGMAEAMKELKKAGVKGVVLDLRFNPGGLLDVACDVTDLFIDDGVIVEVRPRVGPKEVHRGSKEGTYWYDKKSRPLPSYTEFPMVCLVNGSSASGSEIVAAALQDHHRALIMGERTYGKGSVQNVEDFEKSGAEVTSQIKLTVASYWRPSKKNIDKRSTQGRPEDEWGVTPDRVVPLDRAESDELYDHLRDQELILPKGKSPEKKGFKDKQLGAALDYLREQIKTAKKGELPAKKAG